MSITIGSWNVEGRLSQLAINDRGTPEQIVDAITFLDMDILFLPEGCSGNDIAPAILKQLSMLGYQVDIIPYEEGEPLRTYSAVDTPSYVLLSRIPVKNFQTIRLGNLRNALQAVVEDPASGQELRLIGLHLDDRSETLRLKQLPDLLALVHASSLPTLMCGDFNAMHADDPKAILCRRILVHALGMFFVPDLMRRVADMANGTTLARLESEGGLRDVDPERLPTTTPKMRGKEWLPSVRLIQIDHMLITPTVRVSQFMVSRDLGSDHRALTATVSLDRNA